MADTNPKTMKVHAAIAAAVKDQGVDTMFGLIGDANLYLADNFVQEQGGRFISAAHEAGAVLMALGYAHVSGKVGVASVTHGPGLTNTVTALIEGVKSTLPIVLLSGDTPVADAHHLQKVDQRAVIASTGAGFEQLRSPQTIAIDVANAFRRALIESRPIVLNIPVEFQWLDAAFEPVQARAFEHRGLVPASDELDNAVGIIAAARRPLILAGRGAMDPASEAAILALARRIEAPVATTLKGSGLFYGDPFNIGIFGTLSTPVAADTIIESDCVIAFGASLNARTTAQGSMLKGKRYIQVNQERSEVGRLGSPDAGLVGDPGLTADLIRKWLDEAEIEPSGFANDELKEKIAAYSPDPEVSKERMTGTIDVRRALSGLNEAIPVDRTLVTDAGRFIYEAWANFPVRHPRSFVYTLGSGSIGLGMGEAVGAAAAAEGRTTLLVTGDGGFMLGGLAEFNTAVRHGLDLIVVVCNDASYGAEHIQFRNKALDPALALFAWPEFAPLAQALGGEGVTVRSTDDLPAAIDAIRSGVRPLLIDVKLDPDHVPSLR